MADDTAVLLGVEEDALEKDERQHPNPPPPPPTPPPPPPPLLGRATSNATAVMTSQYNGKTRMVAAEAMALSRKTMINVFFSFFCSFFFFFFFFLGRGEEREWNGVARTEEVAVGLFTSSRVGCPTTIDERRGEERG